MSQNVQNYAKASKYVQCYTRCQKMCPNYKTGLKYVQNYPTCLKICPKLLTQKGVKSQCNSQTNSHKYRSKTKSQHS